MVYNVLCNLARGLLPSHCVLCLSRAVSTDENLCSGCRDDLPWLADCCAVCSLPLPGAGNDRQCGRCLQNLPAFDRCVGAFYYAEPVARLISDYKYRARLSYGRVLAVQLAAHIAAHYQQQPLPAALLPVPLHRTRLRARGFNQSLELAKTVGQQLRLPVANCLIRHRATGSQKDLTLAERQRNVRSAFALRSGSTLPGCIAVIDDVVTSGSTVNELARLLKANGVAEVHVWCVARTERSKT